VSETNANLSIRLLFLGNPRYDRRLKTFAEHLRLAGHSVEIICGMDGAVPIPEAGIGIIPLTHTSGPQKFYQYHKLLTAKILTSTPVDLVIACDLYSLGAAATAKKKGFAKRAIYDSREVYIELPSVAHRPIVRAIWRRFEHRHLTQMDAILVTGSYDYQAIFAAHHFIPRGILIRNLPPLIPFVVSSQFRAKHSIANDVIVFVYVGGLQAGRGIEAFIKALPLLDAKSKFVIIGDGAERTKLEKLAAPIKSMVIFTGAVDSEKTLDILGECDIGISLIEPVSISYQYALPSKVFEYMSRIKWRLSPQVSGRSLLQKIRTHASAQGSFLKRSLTPRSNWKNSIR
jgi:glycosyltransferase involved in cell wall biosynthesis